MALNARQIRAYTDTVNLYAPVWPALGDHNQAGDLYYSATPTASAVPCHWEAKPESSMPAAPGRSNDDLMVTTDKFHFASDVAIGDQWMIKLTTPGHPELNSWFTVVGAPETHVWRANKLSVLCKKGVAPVLVV